MECNKNMLDEHVDPGRVRASSKRQHVSYVHCCTNVSIFELTIYASHPMLDQTCHGNEWHPRPIVPVSQ
jgi:hypothetical protein